MKLKTETTTYNHRRQGFVLITVLMIVALLTALLLSVNQTSRRALNAVDHLAHQIRARQTAHAGMNYVIALMDRNPDIVTNEDLRLLLQQPTTYTLTHGSCTVHLESENGKINLNYLVDPQEEPDRSRIDYVLNLIDLINRKHSDQPAICYGLVPSLIDWIDHDNRITVLPFISKHNQGVESEFYNRYDYPYNCRNGKMISLGDLRLIKNGYPEKECHQLLNEQSPWNDLYNSITIYGNGKIDINTAPAQVLHALTDTANSHIIAQILERRQEYPFTSLNELLTTANISNESTQSFLEYITVQPQHQYYTLTATAWQIKTKITITAIVHKNTLAPGVRIISYRES